MTSKAQQDEHMKPAVVPLFFAVRKCDNLKGPAIFLEWDDCRSFVGKDTNTINVPRYKIFQVLTDAMAYISNTYSSTSPQASRKRSAQESFMEGEGGPRGSRKKSLKIFEQGENFEERMQQWQAYKNNHGLDPTDPNKMDEDDGLGTWVDALKRRYDDFLHCRHTCQLTNSKIPCLTRAQADIITKTGLWDSVQNDKESSRTNPLWSTRLAELVAYKANHGDTLVPTSNPGLNKWVYKQREEYRKVKQGKKSFSSEERINKLKEIGFDFDVAKVTARTPSKTWNMHFAAMMEYKVKIGDCRVPLKYPPNKTLGSWVDKQRQEFRKFKKGQTSQMSEERIATLTDAGFAFEPKNLKSPPKCAIRQLPPASNQLVIDQDKESSADEDEDDEDETNDNNDTNRQVDPKRNSLFGSTFAPWDRYSTGYNAGYNAGRPT
jgi:hypothetical protein